MKSMDSNCEELERVTQNTVAWRVLADDVYSFTRSNSSNHDVMKYKLFYFIS